jgi:hypothetical protein
MFGAGEEVTKKREPSPAAPTIARYFIIFFFSLFSFKTKTTTRKMSFFAPRSAATAKSTSNEKSELLKKSQPWVEK